MLDYFLSDDTEYDVYEENDEFIIEQEIELEEEAEAELILGESNDLDNIVDDDEDDDEVDDDPYYDETDDDVDIDD